MNYPLDCSIAIPTYYPGNIIEKLIKSLPEVKEILVLDNGDDIELEKLLSKYSHIKHLKLGDIGLGKTFNKLLEISSSKNTFITQPDVVLRKNCIENLLIAKQKYPDAAIYSPIYVENNTYSKYDFFDLKLDKNRNLINFPQNNVVKNIEPLGDFCVDAVSSTANLFNLDKIKTIGGWDDFFYTYLEDIDLSLRLKQHELPIIKIFNSVVDHKGFGSHEEKDHAEMNKKRVFNFTKSSIYFNFKHKANHASLLLFVFILIKSFIKLILNFLIFRFEKSEINFIRLKAAFSFLISRFYLK